MQASYLSAFIGVFLTYYVKTGKSSSLQATEEHGETQPYEINVGMEALEN